MEIPQKVQIEDIQILNRIRKDLGDIPGLANSIKENGLIEPIVLTHDWVDNGPILPAGPIVKIIAGERRLTALKSLGLTELEHAVHYVWRSELESNDPKKKLLASSIEMEENIRRKDLSWQEQVLGKQKLLTIMQEIHGAPIVGRPSTSEKSSSQPGFGVNKLAAMLNESAASTSQDLEMAALITKIPELQKAPTKEEAKRRLELAMKIALGTQKPQVVTPLQYKILIECKDEEEQRTLLIQFRSVGLKCQPVVA
jgi:hypothetical protein